MPSVASAPVDQTMTGRHVAQFDPLRIEKGRHAGLTQFRQLHGGLDDGERRGVSAAVGGNGRGVRSRFLRIGKQRGQGGPIEIHDYPFFVVSSVPITDAFNIEMAGAILI